MRILVVNIALKIYTSSRRHINNSRAEKSRSVCKYFKEHEQQQQKKQKKIAMKRPRSLLSAARRLS